MILNELQQEQHKAAMERLYNSPEYRELERQISVNNPRIQNLKPAVRLTAIYLLKYGGEFMVDDLWRLFYKRRPPTIEEYLSPKVLPETNQILYPKWRQEAHEIFATGSTFFEVVIGGAIGGGKSTFATILHLYNLIRVALLLNPHATLGSAPNKTLILSLFTITLPKARKALVEPFLALMKECEEYFEYVEDRRECKAGFPSFANSDKIPFYDNNTEIILPKSVNVMLGSQTTHALSFDMFGAFLDEAEFRGDAGGAEKAMEVWNSLRTRVTSRFLDSRFTFVSLVSSARYATGVMATYTKSISPDSKVSKYLSYPIWEIKSFDSYKQGHFYILRGNSANPSRMLEVEHDSIEAGQYVVPEGCEVVKVPKVYYREFKFDLENSIRDLAGMQTLNADFPFQKTSHIEAPFLTPEFVIQAPLGEGIPLINKLPEQLFTETPSGLRLARYGSVYRYAHVDLAEANVAGLTISHKESYKGRTVYVVDLTCEIKSPTRIDINAIEQLLIDLHHQRGVLFHTITADQYQSTAMRQRLEVLGVAQKVELLSVDKTLVPIGDVARLVIEDRLKIGPCPHLREQMEQLRVDPAASAKKVIRGPAGKDQFDSMVGSITNAIANIEDVPSVEYEELSTDEKLSARLESVFDGLNLI